MLLNPTGNRTLYYKEGYTGHAQYVHMNTIATAGQFETVLFRWDGKNISAATIWMFEAAVWPGNAAIVNHYTATGDAGAQDINCSTSQCVWWPGSITAQYLDNTAGSGQKTITQNYNAVFGTGYTDAQLLEVLKQMYPGYNSFGYAIHYGGQDAIFNGVSLNYRYEYQGSIKADSRFDQFPYRVTGSDLTQAAADLFEKWKPQVEL